jgi:hypothetical protein
MGIMELKSSLMADFKQKDAKTNRESVMFSDRRILYVIEYVVGFSLLIAVLPSIVLPHPGWSEAHWWAYLLFIVCASFTLISCASEMRRRMQLSERVDKIEKIVEQIISSQKQTPADNAPRHKTTEHLVNSVN